MRHAHTTETPELDVQGLRQAIQVVISNGVLNLIPDKDTALPEMARVLAPGGRLQIGDILVQRPVPGAAKADIALWTG
jgi:arsenite methyltransferase